MDVDYDIDMDMHAMRDTLPQSQADDAANDGREDLEVQWKSSQTSNRALDSLMLEAAQNAATRATGLRNDWGWGEASAASTSRVKSLPTLLFEQPSPSSSASASGTAAVPPSRRRGRASNAHTASLSMGGPVTSATPDPAQFLKLVKGVSKQADENAGMRARATSGGWADAASVANAAGARGARQSVKQRTMSIRRASGSGLVGTKGKERERDRDRAPVSRTPSSVSVSSSVSPSSVSSPASNYSFLSTDADSSMTSPDRDDWDRRDRGLGLGTMTITQDLMPPPPVPQKQKQKRLPALDVCTPPPSKTPPDLQAADGIVPPPVAVKLEQSLDPVCAGGGPELRMHPLLQQQKPAPPPRNANGNTSEPSAAPTPTPTSTYTHTQPQSQPQPQRRGPPVLGMRRTNTAPPLGGGTYTEGLSSQTTNRKFRPPLLNPEAALASVVAPGAIAGVKVKSEKTETRAPATIPKPGPPPAVRMPPRIAEPLKPVKAEPAQPVVMSTPRRKATQPAPASSPWSDNSFDEHNSFDLDELERVMKEYDD
ncbi:hypothetical protein C8R45DRAFT_1081027 [Mycena sanguinolenta]|nr:hypothetical protein C8R45DRAFT_1081027 [Mycena sanguinolenta]